MTAGTVEMVAATMRDGLPVSEVLARPGTRTVLLAGSRDPNAKLTLILLDGYGAAFVVKVPTNGESARVVREEGELLEAVRRLPIGRLATTLPQPLGYLDAEDLRELMGRLEAQPPAPGEGPPEGTRPFAEARGRLPLPARSRIRISEQRAAALAQGHSRKRGGVAVARSVAGGHAAGRVIQPPETSRPVVADGRGVGGLCPTRADCLHELRRLIVGQDPRRAQGGGVDGDVVDQAVEVVAGRTSARRGVTTDLDRAGPVVDGDHRTAGGGHRSVDEDLGVGSRLHRDDVMPHRRRRGGYGELGVGIGAGHAPVPARSPVEKPARQEQLPVRVDGVLGDDKSGLAVRGRVDPGLDRDRVDDALRRDRHD